MSQSALQEVSLIGNVGADAEMKYLPSGKPVVTFNLAVSPSKKENGEWKDDTHWWRVSVWGDIPTTRALRVVKGCKMFVSGPMNVRTYTSNGADRYSLEVTANKFIFLDDKAKDAISDPDDGPPAKQYKSSGKKTTDPIGVDEDIPF